MVLLEKPSNIDFYIEKGYNEFKEKYEQRKYAYYEQQYKQICG